MKLHISNQTDSAVDVVLEPIGDSFEIPKAKVAKIDISGDEAVQMDLFGSNSVSIWTDRNVTIEIDAVKMEFPAIP